MFFICPSGPHGEFQTRHLRSSSIVGAEWRAVELDPRVRAETRSVTVHPNDHLRGRQAGRHCQSATQARAMGVEQLGRACGFDPVSKRPHPGTDAIDDALRAKWWLKSESNPGHSVQEVVLKHLCCLARSWGERSTAR